MIENHIKDYDDKILFYSDPDEQYSGGKSNSKYHNIVKKYFMDDYDGTIIDENNLKSSYKYSTDDLEGPSEIVLWKDFSILLQEISEGGKKKKTKNTKKKKNKTKRCING